MVQTLALRATQDGIIWPRRPLVSSKGLLSCVQNLPLSSYDKRPTTFRAVAFNASGELLAATDERGHIFVFFVTANRYSLVQHLGVSTINCCFSPQRKTELLVTCEDETVRCIDVQSQTLISTLRGHRLPVKRLSFQKSGKLALSASQDAVILWDTQDWSRYRVLNAGPGVEEAVFVSRGDLVAVCFQDDTIMMWDLESLALKYRFSLPEMEQSLGLQKIAVSDDHQVLVASGQAPCICVWEFESQTIIRIIELPAPINHVVSHAFLPRHNTLVSILANDGRIYFLDVAARHPQIQLEISNRGQTIAAFDIECHGRYLAAITSDGFLLLYDMTIARETAARAYERRRKEGFSELGEHATLRSRSGLQDMTFTDLDPFDTNEVAPEHSCPVPSKLIDSLFGVKHPRRIGPAFERTRGGTAAGQVEMIRMRPASTARARAQVTRGSFAVPSKKTHVYECSQSITNGGKWRSNSLTRPPAQQTAQEIEVNRKRLVRSLELNGLFPKKYRVLVWRFLLRLPKNEKAFRSLVAKGKHPIFAQLKKHYPIQDSQLFRRLHRILSAIVYWCPAFGEVSYLPAMVYPFVKIFRTNDLAAFEASVSVLLHWCGDFLISLPYPPVFAMRAIENELARRDGQLYDHFTRYQISSEVFAWSLLKTIFTKVLSEDEWMCLWDHLFAYSDTPQLIYVAVLAYLSYYRTALLAACDRFSIEQFFHQQNAIEIQSFVQLVMNLRKKVDLSDFTAIENPASIDHTTSTNKPFWPLSRGQYPAFAHYPRFVVDFQISERNRIALEEAKLAHKHELFDQIEKESIKLKKKHENWMKERKMVLDAEERRRKEAIAAERERILHLKTLDYETRKRRLQHLSNLETSANETLKEASRRLQTEYRRLESTLSLQKERTEFEISSREQEEALRRVESETCDRVRDIHKQCEREERLSQLHAEFDSRTQQQEAQYFLELERWKREDEKQSLKADIDLRRREEVSLVSQEMRLRQELEAKLLEQQLAKDKAVLKLKSARRARLQKHVDYDEFNHDISTRANNCISFRECASGTNARLQKGEDEASVYPLSETFSREVIVDEQQYGDTVSLCRDGSSPSDRKDRPRRLNVPPSDRFPTGSNESSPVFKLSDVATQSPLQGSPRSESSMSFASASMRRTLAEMSLLEKVLGHESSSTSSSQNSSQHIEGKHVEEDIASAEEDIASAETDIGSGEASATYADRPNQSMDDQKIQGGERKQGLRPVLPQYVRTIPQTINEGLLPSPSKQSTPHRSGHNKEVRMSQAAQDSSLPNDRVLSALNSAHELSVKSEKTTFRLGLSHEHGENLSKHTNFLVQGKGKSTSQTTPNCTKTKDEDMSRPQETIRSYPQDQEPAYNPLLTTDPRVPATNQRAVASAAELQEVSDSDSEEFAASAAMEGLQRPIAELEKKLGIRFDNSSDEEKDESIDLSFDTRRESDEEEEDEIIDDDCAHLLRRAKRLLELSSFSDEDL